MKVIDARNEEVEFNNIKVGECFTCGKDTNIVYMRIEPVTLVDTEPVTLVDTNMPANAIRLNYGHLVIFALGEFVKPVDVELTLRVKGSEVSE